MCLIVGKIEGSGGGHQQVLCLVFHLPYFQLLFSSWCLTLKDLKVRKRRIYFSREGVRKE